MSDKQDEKKKEGGRKEKKNEAMRAHEHDIHRGQYTSTHPRDEQPLQTDLATAPSGTGHHKRPDDAGVTLPEKSKEDEVNSRHSHVPHKPERPGK